MTPYGALLMLSIPPAATTELSPSLMLWAASMTDFIPLAQTLLMVVASEVDFKPEARATWRAGDWPTPAWTTLPKYTSSTRAGSMFLELSACLRANVPS